MRSRVLIFATRGRDAEVIGGLLERIGREFLRCATVDDLVARLAEGAGAAVVTEESLTVESAAPLFAQLAAQPPWSDFPFILMSTKRSGRRPADAQALLDGLGNVVILERPIHGDTLRSAVSAALRGRHRQFEAERHLDALGVAEARLKRLNETLEARILARTAELTEANNRLTEEIGERERAQAALAQAQKMEAVGQLTGGIAHDFNNLLTVIAGNLDLIAMRTDDPRTTRQIGFAQQAAARAAKLTQQLLVFARTQRLTLETIDLNALVRGMADLLVRTIGTAVAVVIDAPDTPLWATADANQFELAVLNLAINARDAMPDGGTLTIATGVRSDAFAAVEVRDTGTGIPAPLVSKIFDPFFTTKAPGKGTGLGLSQVYAIARQSGGDVEVSSADGQGTVFTLTVPRAAAPALAAAAGAGPVAAPPAPDAHILVIDDDDAVRRFIVESLEAIGYRVTAAASGEEGLARFAEQRPDAVVVDYAMPDMNGLEVVARIRAVSPEFPILLATGFADMEAVHRVVDPRHLLRKPFRTEDLRTTVAGLLAGAVEAPLQAAAGR